MWSVSARCAAALLFLTIPVEALFVSPLAHKPRLNVARNDRLIVLGMSNAPMVEDGLSLRRGMSSSSFLEWYKSSLQSRPIRTKCLSSAVIGCIGSILSQWIVAVATRAPLLINPRLVATFGLMGLLYIGPFYHFWFDQLSRVGSWLQDRYGSSHQKQVLTQVALDQTIGVIIFFPAYFLVFEVFDALTSWRAPMLISAREKCIETLAPVLLANWRVWPVINYVNFRLIPRSLRVLFMNLASVVWNAFFCTVMAS